jgi:hypothetical protein
VNWAGYIPFYKPPKGKMRRHCPRKRAGFLLLVQMRSSRTFHAGVVDGIGGSGSKLNEQMHMTSFFKTIYMLAWIAKEAPRTQKATCFAVMAAFTNLALSASQLGT